MHRYLQVLVATVLLGVNALQPAPASGGIDPGTSFTPLVASVLTEPAPVKASDGIFHIAYELVLTNAIAVPIELTIVEVRDAATHQVLLSLTGPSLLANMNPIGTPSPPSSELEDPPIPSSGTVIVWLDVQVPAQSQLPETLEHRLTGSVVTTSGGAAPSFDEIAGLIPTKPSTPVVLGPPVGDGVWLASEGCCENFTHHRRGVAPVDGKLMVPQRFAIDWFLLDDQHRTWFGDPADVASYLSYGQPVIAAADGTVVQALDGLPDQQPPQPPPIPPVKETVGNHVTLQIAPDLYLLYAHLKPGSVRVQVGQSVTRGQGLAKIGNSGNSTTPHLHFQVLTTPTFFPTDSPPYMFDCFTLVGHENQRIWDDNVGLQETGVLPLVPPAQPGQRQLAMPLDRDVVSFSPSC